MLASLPKLFQRCIVLPAVKRERPEGVVRPRRMRVPARPMGLLEGRPRYQGAVDRDSAEERPAARLSTLAAEHLNIVAVTIDTRRRLSEEVPRWWTDVQTRWEPAVRAGDRLSALTEREWKLHFPNQLGQITPIDQNADASVAAVIDVGTLLKRDR